MGVTIYHVTICIVVQIQVYRVLVSVTHYSTIMLNIMYNNAMGEFLWVLIMPNVSCYQYRVAYIILNTSSQCQ